MAHRRQEQRDARAVAPYVGGFAGRLDHHHAVARGVEPSHQRAMRVELVAEDQPQPWCGAAHGDATARALRQRSEQ